MTKTIIAITAVTVCLTCAVCLWDANHDWLAAAATFVAVICSALSAPEKTTKEGDPAK